MSDGNTEKGNKMNVKLIEMEASQFYSSEKNEAKKASKCISTGDYEAALVHIARAKSYRDMMSELYIIIDECDGDE